MNFNLFKKQQPEPQPHKATDLEYRFKDEQGKKYYEFGSVREFPLERHSHRAQVSQWMSAGLTSQELDKLLDAAESQLEALVAGKKGSLARVGAALHEIRNRKNMVIHSDLLMQYVAVHLIREDENPYSVDLAVMDEKIEAFRKMIAGGRLLDFFQLDCLTALNAHTKLSKEEFQEFWNESQTELKMLNQKIQYLKSNLKSGDPLKTLIVP